MRPDGRLLEAADHPQRRRLAAARRAEQAEELAVLDLEIDVVDGDGVAERLTTSTSLTSTAGTFVRTPRRPWLGDTGGRGPRGAAVLRRCVTRPTAGRSGREDMVAVAGVSRTREIVVGRAARVRDSQRSTGARIRRSASSTTPVDRGERGPAVADGRGSRRAGVAGRARARISTRPVTERGMPSPMTALTEAAVLDALRNVQEPELGRDIVTLDMVKSIVIDGAGGRVHHRADDAGLPAQGRDRDATRVRRWPAIGVDQVDITWGAMVRRAAPAPGRAARPGRQEHHRRRVGQGRRRQEHGQRQPGGRPGPGRRQRRPARRRHHRPQHPA